MYSFNSSKQWPSIPKSVLFSNPIFQFLRILMFNQSDYLSGIQSESITMYRDLNQIDIDCMLNALK